MIWAQSPFFSKAIPTSITEPEVLAIELGKFVNEVSSLAEQHVNLSNNSELLLADDFLLDETTNVHNDNGNTAAGE